MRGHVKELLRPALAHVKVPGRIAAHAPDLDGVPEFTGVVGAPSQAGYTSLPDR